jgi:flavin reductase (DIM6/NTAB) family NADH-FMN oxidoreductase RutF
MSVDDFSTVMASLDSALTVVTVSVDGERAGCLVGFHGQSSIKPERYAIWLSRANHTYPVAMHAAYFGVHFLTAADHALAARFGSLTGDSADKFDGLGVSIDPHGVPLLDACPNRLVGRRVALLDDGGDHVGVVTEPVSVETGGRFSPLRLAAAGDLAPGHDSTERRSPSA